MTAWLTLARTSPLLLPRVLFLFPWFPGKPLVVGHSLALMGTARQQQIAGSALGISD